MNIFQAVNNNDIKQVKTYLKKNSDLVNKRRDGEYPIHLAAEKGFVDIVRILIENQSKVDPIDMQGWTPFFLACSNGHYTTMLELLDHNADATHKCKSGDTPLHAACRHGNMSVIQYLFNFHVEIDAQNNDGWTPLHRATYSSHKDAVIFLINEGADVTLRTNAGKTAFDLALSLRNDYVAEAISHYGYLQQKKKANEVIHKNNEPMTICLGEARHVATFNEEKENATNVMKNFFEVKKLQFSKLLQQTGENKKTHENGITPQVEETPTIDTITSLPVEEVQESTPHENNEQLTQQLSTTNTTDVSNHFKATYDSLCSFFRPRLNSPSITSSANDQEQSAEENSAGDNTEEGKSENATNPPDDDEHECPVCLDVPLPPVHVYQCANGHLYCGNCREMPNMQKCPQCAISIAGVANRNRYAEENIRKLYCKKIIEKKVPDSSR